MTTGSRKRSRPTLGARTAPTVRGSRATPRIGALLVLLCVLGWAETTAAFRLIGSPGSWARWDAAPRLVLGEERSLDGGLRYSIEGGSYEGLRDQFMWVPSPPTTEDFAAAIARAFESWTVLDPATGLSSGFFFVEDLATEAVDEPGNPNNWRSYLGVNPGAEIDIFAETPHAGATYGASVVLFFDPSSDDLTLTSGTTGYAGLRISGADIRINPAYAWTLRAFEVLLTHEIGHTLGLADLEVSPQNGGSSFFDDDYDPSTSATALATLTNSFSLEIDPLDPDASPLLEVGGDLNVDPGLDTPGVELLMETEGIFDLLHTEPLLQNDEFAGRQFLYPVIVPEPGLPILLGAGLASLILRKRSRIRVRNDRRLRHP